MIAAARESWRRPPQGGFSVRQLADRPSLFRRPHRHPPPLCPNPATKSRTFVQNKNKTDMTTFITDIQPILLTTLVGIIIAYGRYVNTLKTRVAVLERTIEDLLKTIEGMQKRLDSHSKKQDEIHDTLNAVQVGMKDMKVEIVKEMGQMASNLSSLASDLKGLNNLLAISDYGIRANKP
jgi:uncharacterized membrane-anchored protein YhcB (DUF1043 family)